MEGGTSTCDSSIEKFFTPSRRAWISAIALAGAVVSNPMPMHLYGTGLASLIAILTDGRGPLDGAVRARLRADPLLSSLLVLHDIHPDPEAARDFDPGPDPAPRPQAAGPAGLVQIDLGRTRAAKRGDGP